MVAMTEITGRSGLFSWGEMFLNQAADAGLRPTVYINELFPAFLHGVENASSVFI